MRPAVSLGSRVGRASPGPAAGVDPVLRAAREADPGGDGAVGPHPRRKRVADQRQRRPDRRSRAAPPVGRAPPARDPRVGVRRRAGAGRAARGLGRLILTTSLGLVVVLAGLPWVSGAPWGTTGSVLATVSVPTLCGLTLLWVAGLWVHTVALDAALPGLRPARALYLNLTGSAASNVLPLGGAAGTAVNYWSCRRWGFTPAAFVRWALVTNLWDNALRLALPASAVAWSGLVGMPQTAATRSVAVTGTVVLAGYLALAWAVLHGATSDRFVRRLLDGLPPGMSRRAGELTARAEGLGEFRSTTLRLVRQSARRVAGGKAAYALAQAALLWSCLRAVGADSPVVTVFVAFAVERIASLAVLTPGGSGFAEVGAVGVLVGSGTTTGAEAVAAVLLYRAYIFLLEIPVGVVLLLLTRPLAWRHRGAAARDSVHRSRDGSREGGDDEDGARAAVEHPTADAPEEETREAPSAPAPDDEQLRAPRALPEHGHRLAATDPRPDLDVRVLLAPAHEHLGHRDALRLEGRFIAPSPVALGAQGHRSLQPPGVDGDERDPAA